MSALLYSSSAPAGTAIAALRAEVESAAPRRKRAQQFIDAVARDRISRRAAPDDGFIEARNIRKFVHACSKKLAKAAWALVYRAEQTQLGGAPFRGAEKSCGRNWRRRRRWRASKSNARWRCCDDGPSQYFAKVRSKPVTTPSGSPYFAMELISGAPLTRFCDEHKFALRERLKLFIEVCLAVQHAHQKGIIHRDLKPSNILASLRDGVPAVKVIDFGIAKPTEREALDGTAGPELTQLGAIVGNAARVRCRRSRPASKRRRLGHAQRRVLARGAAVRAADRHYAVRSARQPDTHTPRIAARDPRRRNAAACSTRLEPSRPDNAAIAQQRRSSSHRGCRNCVTRRPGLDRRQSSGKRTRSAALRLGPGTRARYRTLSERRAGGSPRRRAAGVPILQNVPPQTSGCRSQLAGTFAR